MPGSCQSVLFQTPTWSFQVRRVSAPWVIPVGIITQILHHCKLAH